MGEGGVASSTRVRSSLRDEFSTVAYVEQVVSEEWCAEASKTIYRNGDGLGDRMATARPLKWFGVSGHRQLPTTIEDSQYLQYFRRARGEQVFGRAGRIIGAILAFADDGLDVAYGSGFARQRSSSTESNEPD